MKEKEKMDEKKNPIAKTKEGQKQLILIVTLHKTHGYIKKPPFLKILNKYCTHRKLKDKLSYISPLLLMTLSFSINRLWAIRAFKAF